MKTNVIKIGGQNPHLEIRFYNDDDTPTTIKAYLDGHVHLYSPGVDMLWEQWLEFVTRAVSEITRYKFPDVEVSEPDRCVRCDRTEMLVHICEPCWEDLN